jgi:hypothetical protein
MLQSAHQLAQELLAPEVAGVVVPTEEADDTGEAGVVVGGGGGIGGVMVGGGGGGGKGAPIHRGSDGSGRCISIVDSGQKAAETVGKKGEVVVTDYLGSLRVEKGLTGQYNASEADGGAAAGLVDETGGGESKGRAFEQDGLELVGDEVGAREKAIVSLPMCVRLSTFPF